ncbi:hypothetical protein [Amycolatopsis sp. YIM 10]|uniref:hypothetical protein n=1 Tax=Amycolatopsis sp. YIM 10 TaxID=2653857 RepID=UPI00129025E0|nr:hypothetical protein [Amycolatopsis sp. YIM 10]QFU94121.1 hypothetical protein YIM_44955 [Amycolatopsis sp. YIM 10]
MRWLREHRVVAGIVSMVLVVLAGGGYVLWTSATERAGATAGAAIPGDLLFIDQSDGRDVVQRVPMSDPDGPRQDTAERCQRVYSAAGTTVCLRLAGPGPSYEVAVLGADGRVLRTLGLAGIPNRARVSESGQIVSWTSFVTGDSYAVPGGFSTRTGVLDLRTGVLVESLEDFATTVAGEPLLSADRNYWGVTVAGDDRTFYATVSSQNRTWLVKGDLITRTMREVRPGPECPSLSPDGTKVAYKKRVGRFGQWELAVLDLTSHHEQPLPGTTGIDDQAVWLDNTRLAYGRVPGDGRKSSVFAVPADGSAPPELLVAEASSPVPLR